VEIEYTENWFQKNADDIKYWFDPKIFNWLDGSYPLAKYCFEYFELWWDSDKFDCNRRYALGSCFLAKYCTNYFDIWWDAERFNWEYSEFLVKYCCDYRHIWCQDKRCRDALFPKLRGNSYLPIVKVS